MNQHLETLATLCERDEAGRHFTATTPAEVLSALEDAGLIAIYCPIHPVTGLPYSEEYWHLEITEAGLAAVEAMA